MPDATHTLAQLRAGKLKGIHRLDCNGGLTRFPREIFDLARQSANSQPVWQ